MSKRYNKAVLYDLAALWGEGSLAGSTDAELVTRYAGGDERSAESAFSALMSRHGPLVLGTCRRLLRDPHDVEDAFQATFLVLVRKARYIRVGDSLAPWLYAVACRIAARVRVRGRGRQRQAPVADEPAVECLQSATEFDDIRRLLHEEIGKLPEKYRAPIVLCHLEGKSHEQASRELRWPLGTLNGRLARAREVLRLRLSRHGLTVPVGALLAVLSTEAATAKSAALAESAIHMARRIMIARSSGANAAGVELLAREAAAALNLRRWLRVMIPMPILACTMTLVALWMVNRRSDPPTVIGPETKVSRPIPSVASDAVAKEFMRPPSLSLRAQHMLSQIAADVAVLDARQQVLSGELKKAGEDLERARIAAMETPDTEKEGRAKREPGGTPDPKIEKLNARLERLKTEFAKVAADYKFRNEEGLRLESALLQSRK